MYQSLINAACKHKEKQQYKRLTKDTKNPIYGTQRTFAALN